MGILIAAASDLASSCFGLNTAVTGPGSTPAEESPALESHLDAIGSRCAGRQRCLPVACLALLLTFPPVLPASLFM